MTASTKPSLVMLRLAVVDPLNEVAEDLDAAIDMLITTWIALQSDDLLEAYGPDHCHRTMEMGIDRVRAAQKKATSMAETIREECL